MRLVFVLSGIGLATVVGFADATPPAVPHALNVRTATTAQADDLTTADGVYSRRQADEGRDLFALACQNCHAPTQHAGNDFRGKWFGRSLGELFGYLRREMPKTDPGTMSDVEYAALVAYLMRINRMPAGQNPLAADSAALHRIRIDSVSSTPPPEAQP